MAKIDLTSEYAPAIVLAIDPGAKSGWSIHCPPGMDMGSLSGSAARLGLADKIRLGICEYGESKSTRDHDDVVCNAIDWSVMTGLSLIVVGESWKGGGGPHGNSQKTNAGLGAAWGKWQAILDLRGHPARRVVRIDTGSWRRALFGRTRMKSADWKRSAKLWAQKAYNLEKLGSDEAEAICIGSIAQRWTKVHALCLKPKARRKRK